MKQNALDTIESCLGFTCSNNDSNRKKCPIPFTKPFLFKENRARLGSALSVIPAHSTESLSPLIAGNIQQHVTVPSLSKTASGIGGDREIVAG